MTTISGAVDNSGTINVGPGNNILTIGGPGATLEGGGQVLLSDSPNNQIVGTNDPTFTNVDNTISGAGSIASDLSLVNEQGGVIDATDSDNELVISTGETAVNDGTMEATGAGALHFANQTVQNSGGLIEASGTGSIVYLQGADIEGGTLSTANGGAIDTLAVQGRNVLDGTGSAIDNAGNVVVTNNTNLALRGTIDNTGTIALDSTGSGTGLVIDNSGVMLQGNGTVTMTDNAGNIIQGNGNGNVLTSAGNTIEGAGTIGGNGLTLVNEGVIDATGVNNALILDQSLTVTNTGTLEATGTGGLLIQSATVNNVGGVIQALGAHVDLQGAHIAGGTLSTANGGVIDTLPGSKSTLDGTGSAVDNAGNVVVTNNTNLALRGTIDNTGTIALDSTGSGTGLVIDNSGVMLQGDGTVTMTDNAGNFIQGNGNGNVLTNAGNTIEGAGAIGGNGLALVNAGVIDATGVNNALIFDQSLTVTNTGTLEATGSGGLLIQNTTVNNVGGVIQALGAHVDLQGAHIEGGTLATTNGGVIDTLPGSKSILDGISSALDIAGSVVVTNNTNLALRGTIDNTGTITLDSTGSGTGLVIDSSGVMLQGNGTVTMTDNAGNFIQGNGNGNVLTNAGNTIEGAGTIGGNGLGLVNAGVIDATGVNNALILDQSLTITNTGTLEATGSGELLQIQSTVDNVGGVIQALGAHVDLQGAHIEGGTLATTNGGVIDTLPGSKSILDGTSSALDIAGNVVVTNNTNLALRGTIDNTGTIALDSTGSSTGLVIDNSQVMLQGGGTVTMTDNAGNFIQGNSNGNLLTNAGNTIEGAGTIGGNGLGLVNQQAGIIEATHSDHALVLQTNQTVTNDGTLEANGGVLIVNDNVTGAGIVEISGGGTADLAGSFGENAAFNGAGELEVLNSFSGTISDMTVGDSVYVSNASLPNGATLSFQENGTNTGGTLAVFAPGANSATISLNLAGDYGTISSSDFSLTSQGTGTVISDTSAAAAAIPTLPATRVNLGSFHVGATATTPIAVTNSSTNPTEALDVTVSGAIGDAYGSGSIALLGAGQTIASNIVGGLNSVNGGVQTGAVLLNFVADGTGPGGDGKAPAEIGSQYVTLDADFFREATASVTAPALIVHVGDTGSENLTVANTDAADGFSEKLDATVTGFTGGLASATGSTTVAAGASNNTSFSVGYATTQVGMISGDVDVQLTSDGSGVDSFGTTPLGTIQVPVTVTVDNYAKEALSASTGQLTSIGTSYTLNLGTVEQGAGPLSANIIIENSAAGPADVLSGDITLATGTGFNNSGLGTFSGLGAGQNATPESISLPTATLGTFSETFVIQAAGSNSSGYSGALPGETLTVTGTVAPAPDLVVSSIDAPATALAGQQVSLTWTLENEGAATATGPWQDDVYLAPDAAGDNPQLIGTFTYDGSIAAGASASRTEVVTIPRLLSGNQYFVVKADATNAADPSPGIANHETVASSPTAVTPEPLPKLEVTSITPPASAFSGQQAQVSWTVTNEGDAGTSANSWVDKVYLSTSQTINSFTPFDLQSDPLLVSVPNLTYLAPGGSYTNTATFTLPVGISGPYYLVVETDANDQVFEAPRGTDNISASSVVGVTLTPPPDLQVTTVLAPANAFSGQPITVSWTVINTGSGGTVETAWTDQVWMSLNGVLDSNSTILGTVPIGGPYGPGQSYTDSLNATLPVGVSGNATFFVVADYQDRVFEGALHANNIGSTPSTTNLMLTPPPDLVATVQTVPANALAGHAIQFTYTVANEGSTTTPNSDWTDDIYLSSTPTLTGSATLLSTTTHFGALAVGQSYTASPTVDLPSGLSGSYYLIVQANATKPVFEVNYNNDISSSNVIAITQKLPDLAVSSVTVPSQGEAGHQVQLSWQVTNSGTGDTALATLLDEVILSASGVLGASDNIDLGDFAAPGGPSAPLAPGASYTQQEDVNLPISLNGNYSLFVVTDPNDGVLEVGYANNASAGQAISVGQHLADLQVATVSAPASVIAGSAVTVQWTVDNAGNGATDASYWSDDIYVSATPTLTGSSRLLGQVQHNNTLAAGGSYNASGSFALPADLAPGSYYFIVATGDRVTETSHNDDTAASPAVQIAASPPQAALAVTALTAPSQAISGQTFDVSYKVTNLGSATSGGWNDAVYLSPNQVLGSNSDIFLGYVSENALAAGASRNASQSFTIPNGVSGPYSLFVVADPTNALNESSLANNTASSAIQVALPPVADFSVGAITAQVTRFGTISVDYTVNNLSSNAEPGIWQDALYLSSDGVWNPSDPLLGIADHVLGVAGNSSYTGNLTADVPGIIPGNYYVIVRTDISSESIGTNATGVSATPLSISLPSLTLGTPASGSLTPANSAISAITYYQFTVGAGQTLDLSLTTNPDWLAGSSSGGVPGTPTISTISQVNDLYVKYGALPTGSNFDASSGSQYSADASVVLRDTQAGTYYVAVVAESVFNTGYTPVIPQGPSTGGSGAGVITYITNTEDYSLKVQAVPFSINSVAPSFGSNLGGVTLTIDGAQFGADDKVELVAPNGSVLESQSVQFVDSGQIWANFNLQGLATGTYGVQVIDGSQTASLAHAVTVNNSQVGQLSVSLVLPANLKEGQSGLVTVDYANTGNTDIAAPILDLTTAQALFDNSDGSSTGNGDITFLATNPNGPAGILAPGAEGTQSFVFTPTQIISHQDIAFTASTFSPDAPIDWASVESTFRPPTVDATDWHNIWTEFVANVGNTYGSLDNVLSQLATELSQIGQTTTNISTLLQFELLQTEGGLVGAGLASGADIVTTLSPLSLPLVRTYGASLLDRNEAGLFGDGWTSTYDAIAATDASGNVYVTAAGIEHVFTLQADGSYAATAGETAILSAVNGLYRMQDAGVVVQFNAAGKVNSYTDANGNTVSLSYDSSGNLHQVTEQTTGETITFTSNAEGHITSATNSAGTEVYTYDPTGKLLLSATGPEGISTYTYEAPAGLVNDNALTSVTNTDGTEANFTYNAQGLLASSSGANGVGLESYGYGTGQFTITGPSGSATTGLFDATGQIAQIQDSLGNTTQLQYDNAGHLTGFVAPGNNASTYSADTLGNITRVTDALGDTVTAAYARGTQNLTDFTNQLGSQTHYTYNAAGEATGIIYQDGSGGTYSYNTEGLMTGSTDANGNTTAYSYNSASQLIQESFGDGTSNSFTYDARGNLLTATAGGATTAYSYNSANQLTSAINPAGQVESYAYNANGQLAAMTDPNGAVTQYSYDAAGQLAEMQDGSGNLLDKYIYDGTGKLIETLTGNGASTTYVYDADGRTVQILNRGADGSVASFDDYTYNANSQVVAENTSDGNWSYGYDADGKLTGAIFQSSSAAVQSQNISYVYDAAGNRTSQTVNGVTTHYTLNSMNQVVASSEGTTYGYDAGGNLISETNSSGTTTFSYDAKDELIAENGPGGNFHYTYDAFGNLVSQTQNGVTTNYVENPLSISAGGQPLTSVAQAYNSNGGVLATYEYGLGLAATVNSSGNVAYFNTDANGNVTGLTGSDGSLQDSYFYLPYGQATQITGTASNPFQYSGKFGVITGGSGLDLMRARSYDPVLGRFTSPDPLGIAASQNLYEYVSDDPLDQADPSGQKGIDIGIAGGLFGGGLTFGLQFTDSGKVFFYSGVGAATPGLGGSVTGFRDGSDPSEGVTVQTQAAAGPGVFGVAGSANVPLVFSKEMFTRAHERYGTELGIGAGFGGSKVTGGGVYEVGTHEINPFIPVATFIGDNLGDFISGQNVLGPATKGHTPVARRHTSQIRPGDPNDIFGPAAFGPQNFVSASQPLAYTVEFENEATATAPAQTLTITEQLDSNLDWRTFRLTGFGFDNLSYSVGSVAFYDQRIDLTAIKGYYVDVTAGVNVATGLVTWTFQTIDPATGQTPLDPTIGLLPLNDANNDGDGFVSYTVQANSTAPTGALVDAQATVVFDTQPPINTPIVSDTLDAVAPVSRVQALPAQTSNTTFEVSWSGQDNPAGSGIASYTVYVSTDGGAATPWLTDTTLTSALFTGQTGNYYAFSSTAASNAGNVETEHATPDTTIVIGQVAPPQLTVSGNASFIKAGSPVTLSPAVTLTDAFSQTLSGATVAITGRTFTGDGDLLAAATAGTAITATYDSADETLTLSGTDTLANYSAVLGSVTFSSSSQDPTGAGADPTRTVTWLVNDGVSTSSPATTNVNVDIPVAVAVQTANGIDLTWATLYDELANSAIAAGGTTTQYTAVDDGHFSGQSAAIKFVVTGIGLTYSGSSPDIELTGGTITGVQEQNTSGAVLATFAGFSISATTFQTALNTYLAGGANPDQSALNTIFLALAYNVTGGAGLDALQGGNLANTFDVSIGNDIIQGGTGANTADYSGLTTPGLLAIIQGGRGTVNMGAGTGIETLTNIQSLVDTGTGRTNGDVFYVDAIETVTAASSNFNYLIELTPSINLSYGNFTGISEFVSNVGTNVVNFSSDPNFAYLYGSTGNDTLTLGSGGGYAIGEGGANVLTGGANATNLFIGADGGSDTMNGGAGTASNYYFIDGNDQLNGAGAFNAVVELAGNVNVQLGSAQYQDIQEFVANGGTNTVSVANSDTNFSYLYGGTGNDALSTGSGGGYLIGEGGTNTLNGGGGLNVFVADDGAAVDTMNGGSGSNVYYIDVNSVVHGAGTFNTVIELQQNASLVLGSAQLGTDVQQVVLNGGINTADFSNATTPVYLYGGSGNDTLFGGTGNDFLYGGAGTNTFAFQQGWGHDTIMDWTAGTNSQIDLTALSAQGVHGLSDLTQNIVSGADVITSSHTASNSITLNGLASTLAAASFKFA